LATAIESYATQSARLITLSSLLEEAEEAHHTQKN